jgi:hypothetical protein
MAAKCVDRSGPSQNFTTVLDTARNEVFFPGPHMDSLAIDNQGIAALHDHHVFVVIVGVGRGYGGLRAAPKCHLASIRSIEDKALNARSRLIGFRNLVGGMLHEFWKIFHGC